jgi:hypothetical protein
MELDEFNKFSFSVDANKLLVPTNPYITIQSVMGQILFLEEANSQIGVASGIFGSFTDAPGTPIFDDNGSTITN